MGRGFARDWGLRSGCVRQTRNAGDRGKHRRAEKRRHAEKHAALGYLRRGCLNLTTRVARTAADRRRARHLQGYEKQAKRRNHADRAMEMGDATNRVVAEGGNSRFYTRSCGAHGTEPFACVPQNLPKSTALPIVGRRPHVHFSRFSRYNPGCGPKNDLAARGRARSKSS
jgi:hypothetical protein